MKSKFLATGMLALAVTGCSNQAIPASTPSASVVPEPTSSKQSTSPTTNASTPEPTVLSEPSGGITVVSEFIKACDEFGFTTALVVITTQNTGTAVVKQEAFDSDYTIYDNIDDVVATGSFLYAYPTFLAPGQIGYLIDEVSINDAKAKNVKRVESDVYFSDEDTDTPIVLETGKVKAKRESFGNSLFATGTVKNISSETVQSGHVGVVFLDGSGKVLGASTTNLVENLKAGQTKGFETIPMTCSLKLSSVKKVVAVAGIDN